MDSQKIGFPFMEISCCLLFCNKLLVAFHVDQNNKLLVVKQQVACYKTTSSMMIYNKQLVVFTTTF